MRKVLFLLSSAILAQPALAQDYDPSIAYAGVPAEYAEAAPAAPADTADASIVVTATGLPLAISQTGQPISVIGLAEIESVQGPDLARVLQRLPGTTITRNGGLGSFTGVRVRGGASEQLLVLIDGVKVNDVASPAGGFDFGNVTAEQVERIELLRGPNSVVWGSDAMGGVMNLSTRVPDGVVASAEYGSRDTWSAMLGGGMRTDRLELGVTGTHVTTDGFSTAIGGTEKDGWRQSAVSGRTRFAVTPELALVGNARWADARLEYDFPPFDTNDVQDTEQKSGRIGVEYAAGALALRGGYSLADTERVYRSDFGDYPIDGRARRAELFGRIDVAGPVKLDFGADREWTRYRDPYARYTAQTTSGHALLGFVTPFLAVSAGARVDDHSQFGTEWTLGGNALVRLAADLAIRASYGEGFKAPTLSQLYDAFYGNLDLRPERSKGYDAGVEKGDRSGAFFAGLSVFRRDSRDLIVADAPSYVPYNINRARAEGVELELSARPSAAWRTGLVWSYVETEDRTEGSPFEGNDLNRRPRHALTATADWATPIGLELGVDARLVGDSFDDRAETVRLDGYETVDLRAAMPFGPVELFGRVENLFDTGYATAANYATGGRSAYLGARFRM